MGEFCVAKVYSFSENNKTEVHNMEEEFVRFKQAKEKNWHHQLASL